MDLLPCAEKHSHSDFRDVQVSSYGQSNANSISLRCAFSFTRFAVATREK